MAEYISRSKAEFELCEGNIPEPYRSFCRRVINDRNIIPAADVAPVVHGRRVDYGGFYCRCSQCEGTLPVCSNYCPNCGAKMDGARNGEEKD